MTGFLVLLYEGGGHRKQVPRWAHVAVSLAASTVAAAVVLAATGALGNSNSASSTGSSPSQSSAGGGSSGSGRPPPLLQTPTPTTNNPATHNAPTFSWDAVPGATDYDIYRTGPSSGAEGGSTTASFTTGYAALRLVARLGIGTGTASSTARALAAPIETTQSTTYSDTTLRLDGTADGTYLYEVVARGAGAESDPGSVTMTLDTISPNEPDSTSIMVTDSSATPGDQVVSWDAMPQDSGSQIISYQVTIEGFEYTTSKTSVEFTPTSTIGNLDVSLVAVDDAGNQIDAATASFPR